jgi:nucleotide-binding universal stress UspA family protein
MKVLVGVEDVKSSQATLQALIAQFAPKGTEVRILHVVAPITYFAPPEMAADYAPELEDQMKEGRQLMEEIAKSLLATGFKVSTAVRQGDVREVIIDSAAEWPADLIFVGSHGRKGLQLFLLGSVAEFVARHARCSVEIVRDSTLR